MPDDIFDTLDGEFNVEVTVTCGRTHGVSLSTVVGIPKENKQKGRLRLREVILFLRDSLPINELKLSDEDFSKASGGAAITKDGEVIPAPSDLLDTNRKIVETQKALKIKSGPMK
jgi:hypothetical protein